MRRGSHATICFLISALLFAAHASLGAAAVHIEPFNVSQSPADSRSPALAVSADTVHVVWEESGRIYHRLCRAGSWSSVRSVATGEQPSIAVDMGGNAHVVFVNEFGGNYEIYYCRWNGVVWSLPRNVSNTSGVSSAPNLAIGPDGRLHVVWADNTPGYNVIYYAYWDGRYWINAPIPNASGGAPAIAVSTDGIVHVVWQDRHTLTSPYDVYYSRWNTISWSLPENLSDSSSEQSIIPDIVTDGNDQVHVVWEEKVDGRYAIYYTWGRVGSWAVPEKISNPSGEVESYLPCIAVDLGNALHVGWDQSIQALYRQKGAGDPYWAQITTVLSDTVGLADLQIAVGGDGQIHAVWNQRVSASNWDILYANLSFRLALPVVVKQIAS